MIHAAEPAYSIVGPDTRLDQERLEDAIQVLGTAFNHGVSAGSEVRGFLGYAYARAGRREVAEKFAGETPSINAFNKALIFAGLGDKDHTLEALNRATVGGHSGWVGRLHFQNLLYFVVILG